jgi:hypothetical protein
MKPHAPQLTDEFVDEGAHLVRQEPRLKDRPLFQNVFELAILRVRRDHVRRNMPGPDGHRKAGGLLLTARLATLLPGLLRMMTVAGESLGISGPDGCAGARQQSIWNCLLA